MAKVSVVIPYKNVPHEWFKECLDSLDAQTFRDFEIIVIDDYSNNPEPLLEHKARVTWWLPSRTNYVEAVNMGVALADGEYMMQFSGNDVLFPHALETLVGVLNTHPEAEFVAPHGSDWSDEIYQHCTMYSPATLFRRSLLLRFPQVVPPSGAIGNTDWHQWMLMRRAGVKGVCIPDTLASWRQHDDSLSHAIVAHPGFQETLRWMKEGK